MQGPEVSGKNPIEEKGEDHDRVSKLERVYRKLREYKKADDDLGCTSVEWTATFDATKDSIMVIDSDSRITQANLATSRLLGKPLEEIIGKSCWQVVHGTRQPPKGCPLKKALSSGEHEEAELYLQEKNIWIEVSTDPIINSQDKTNSAVHMIRDITKRKRTEKALRESEVQLQRAQEVARVGSWSLALGTHRLVWSDETYRIFGVPVGQPLIETDFLSLVHPVDLPYVKESWDIALQGGPYDIEHRIVVGQTIKWVREKAQLEFDAKGRPLLGIGTVQDITEQKKAELEGQAHVHFLESMDRINRAIQGTNDLEKVMSEVLDGVLDIFECDRAFFVFPCDPNSPSWSVPMERTRPEYPGALAMGLEMQTNEEIARVARTLLAANGPVRFDPGSEHLLPPVVARKFGYQSMIGMAIYPKTGNPWMFGLHQCSYARVWTLDEGRLFQEIGRRFADALTSLMMLRDLKESEERYRAIFEQAIDSMLLLDPETGQIQVFNDKTFENLGYTRQELKKLNLKDIEAVESPSQISTHMQQVIKKGADTFETKQKKRNGQIRDVLVSAKIISVHGRKLIQSIWRDITERKKAEDKLCEYQRKLKAMASKILQTEERERQRLAVGLHDDICQKLVLSKLTLESSLRSVPDAELVASLKIAAETIGETISQAESMTFELSNPVLREFGFIAALEQYLATQIRGKHGMAFELEADKSLEPLEDNIKTCLFRVTRELLTNVVKHARSQKVIVSVREAQGEIHVTVRDDGVGFELARVRGGNSRAVRFGLFSVREQLEHLGGRFIIESKPGRGTVATVII
ncbi:PAS domain S-box protein [Planctomycetota bacterium]